MSQYNPGISSWPVPLPSYLYEKIIFEKLCSLETNPRILDLQACLVSLSTIIDNKRYYITPEWIGPQLLLGMTEGDVIKDRAWIHQCFQWNISSVHPTSSLYDLTYHDWKMASSSSTLQTGVSSLYFSQLANENHFFKLEAIPSNTNSNQFNLLIRSNSSNTSPVYFWNAVTNDPNPHFEWILYDSKNSESQWENATPWEIRIEYLRPLLSYSFPINDSATTTTSSTSEDLSSLTSSFWLKIWMIPLIAIILIFIGITILFAKRSHLTVHELERLQPNRLVKCLSTS